MSENENKEVTPVEKAATSKSIFDYVAITLTQAGPKVRETVLGILVQRELDRRTQAIVKIIDQVEKAQKEIRRFKPNVITYNENGDIVSSNWTKEALEEKKKAKEQIARMETALENALEKGDFSKLFELAGK